MLTRLMPKQADHTNRGYYPFGMGSAKNPYSQEDRKEAFNAYGMLCFFLLFVSGWDVPCFSVIKQQRFYLNRSFGKDA